MSRVQSLLNRIVEHAGDASTIKTCCGVLSILSRTEDKKAEIASSGLLLILQAMHTHIGNEELLEAACDLLWTLAFNNRSVKASISAHGGIHTLLRCIDAHKTNAELLRSVLGTLSNLSELPENQHHIGIGLPVIVTALQMHTRNIDLVAFAFDTLASIVVGHKKNCLTLQQAGAMGFILEIVAKHPSRLDLVKSGCHTLAIMCDLAGMGAAIVQVKGVKPLLALLGQTPLPPDIERILTVLIFRISKEPPVLVQLVHDGLIAVLFQGMANAHRSAPQSPETLLATCHILCQVTRHANEHAMDLTPYLPLPLCSSETLLRVALNPTTTTPSLALAIFRIVANMAKNPKELTSVVTMAAIETMLSLCTAHGNPPEMLHVTVEVLCRLRRSTLQAYALKTPEKTLTALLVCIRSFPDDIAFLDQAFAILMVYVTSERASSARTVFGFVGAAMRFLSRFSTADWSPHLMIEACKFLLHTIATKDGVESIGSCGGVAILKKFQHDVAKKALPPELSTTLHAILLRLDPTNSSHYRSTPSLALAASSKSTTTLPSLTSTHTSEPEPPSAVPTAPDDKYMAPVLAMTPTSRENNDDTVQDDDVNECDDILDDDDEDDDDDDEADAEDDDGDDFEEAPLHAASVASLPEREGGNEARPTTAAASPEVAPPTVPMDPIIHEIATTHPYPQDVLSSHRLRSAVTDDGFYYASPSGKQLPKHPQRPLPQSYDDPVAPTTTVLSPTCPWTLEPLASSFLDDIDRQLYSEARRQERIEFLNERIGSVVYQSSFAAGATSQHSCIPNAYPYEPVPPPTAFASSLTFESEFASGNLLRAVQIGPFEYDLVLRADLHTVGYTQWFYFAISNVEAHVPYRLHILNLYKPDSLFNDGLQPVVYSLRDAATQGMGWRRRGTHVCYYSNPWPLPRKPSAVEDPATHYHTLTFTLEFPQTHDTYLIAHSYPYTMADHAWHLRQPQFRLPSVVRHSVLCQTQGKLDCDLLRITDFSYPSDERLDVVLTARVHPGEPQASWVMRGTLDFLVSDAVEAKLLRRLFVFHVIPVLNPDGVYYGNNRCGLSACDLNRQWKAPNAIDHPTIFHAKALIESLSVVFYCDFHGHSRKMNVFMYGCDSKKHPNPIARYFPRLLANGAQRYVLHEACNFQVNRGREATARVVVGRDLGVANSFTLEASFCGADFGVLSNMHFNIRHLLDLGLLVGQALLEFAVPAPMDRSPLLEWVQQASTPHPSLYAYIASQYAQKDVLWSTMPLHLTRIKMKKPLKKTKSVRGKKATKLRAHTTSSGLLPTPVPPISTLATKRKEPIKAKAKPPLLPKPSENLKKELKLLKQATMPPPLALKKDVKSRSRSDTPIPRSSKAAETSVSDNNHSEPLGRVLKKAPTVPPRSVGLGFRRLALPTTTSCMPDGDDLRRSRRVSFPTVTK